MAVSRSFSGIKTVGYAHRSTTAAKARQLGVACEIDENLKKSVSNADLVILATPISIFESILKEIAPTLKNGCIVTDVGSTKNRPQRWAEKHLPENIHYVGSHPIAGSEQRGVDYARDDLFEKTLCIITKTKKTNEKAAKIVENFWSKIGCSVKILTPAKHDRIFASISHLPHITAAALLNANSENLLRFAGKGFIDTSRIASGPANIWADILITNSLNCTKAIDRLISELLKTRDAINSKDKKQIEKLLKNARKKRAEMINYKMKVEEVIS